MEQSLPKFHETFIPVLQVLFDSGPLHYKELERKVVEKYYSHLSPDLLQRKIKSGAVQIFNRIGWARTYLKQAGMVVQPQRAMVQITNKGKDVLAKGTLTLRDIRHDADFINVSKANKEAKAAEEIDENATPQDLIDSGFEAIEAGVKADLLARLKIIDPYYFQKVILKLLERMGYGDFVETPKSGDGGIDGVITQDKLGLDKIYIQAKRYSENKIREGEIRNFIGAMSRDANKGIFVTTSTFDEKALQKARDASQKIITVDGTTLADLMYKYGIGVQVKETYEIRQLDEDFFEEN